MEKIGNTLRYQFKPFSKGGNVEKQREAFERGKKLYQEGKIKFDGVKIYWVKKYVKKSEWNNWYSQNSVYCPLQNDKEGMWVGFAVAKKIPLDCQECDEIELLHIDDYRRANNIRPFPLEKEDDNQ